MSATGGVSTVELAQRWVGAGDVETTYFGMRPRRRSAQGSPARSAQRGWRTSRGCAGPAASPRRPIASSCSTLAHAARSVSLILVEPAAAVEALLAGRVLPDAVERDVLTDNDCSHDPGTDTATYR